MSVEGAPILEAAQDGLVEDRGPPDCWPFHNNHSSFYFAKSFARRIVSHIPRIVAL
jgi:hypothetical protein